MIANKYRRPRSLLLAAALIVGAAYVAWVSVRTTALQLLSGGNSPASAIIVGKPDYVLSAAMGRFVADRARVRPALLPAIRQAATEQPLDERPFLLVGSHYLWSGQNDAATATLEAGRRLNPRQRWIHILLLDRYLRSGKYALAADEFGVLSRLVLSAQSPIATALAQMSVQPETRDAVRMTLREDPALERSVLTSLASSDVAPSTIFAMASPAAYAAAGQPGGWGTVLVDRLVAKQRYAAARTIWQRINRLSAQQVAPLLFNAELANRPERAPFNWTVNSGSVAAVDLRSNQVEVNYYGRDNGDLMSQLLVLPPGTYQFATAYSGLRRASGQALVWSVACANQPDRALGRLELQETGSNQRQLALRFTVPAGCPAQQLRLAGLAGEFPSAVSATITRVQLERLARP